MSLIARAVTYVSTPIRLKASLFESAALARQIIAFLAMRLLFSNLAILSIAPTCFLSFIICAFVEYALSSLRLFSARSLKISYSASR